MLIEPNGFLGIKLFLFDVLVLAYIFRLFGVNELCFMSYTNVVGFLSTGCSLKMVYEKPKHVGAYNVFI
jgi:hypothetical protein